MNQDTWLWYLLVYLVRKPTDSLLLYLISDIMVDSQWLFNDTHGFVNMLSADFYSTHSRTMKIIKSDQEHFLLRIVHFKHIHRTLQRIYKTLLNLWNL